MDANQIKEHIIEDDSRIELILEKLDCHKIREYATEYRCALPEKENPTAVSVKKDTLKTSVFTSSNRVAGDIITLTMHLKDVKFIKALRLLHEYLGLEFKLERKQEDVAKFDPLAKFRQIKLKSRHSRQYDSSQKLKIYDSSILDDYIIMPHLEFLREGILHRTQEKFKIGFCPQSQRIVIPHRYYNGEENQFVGIVGRTVNKNYDLLDIPKYFPLKKFPKGQNLFGYQENYEGIQQSGMVIVVEGEKSVLKGDTFKRNNMVAIGGHEITKEQERLLLGLNVEIVIAFDKGIDEDFIKDTCKRFARYRPTSYIFDKYDILKGKDAPVDRGLKAYDYLLKWRIKYNVDNDGRRIG